MADARATNLRAVRSQVDAVLEEFLAEKARVAAGRGHPPEVVQTVRGFLAAGGALLVGNVALMWAQELLHTAPVESGRLRRVHELYDAMLGEVMYGQYLDVMGTGRGADDIEAALRIIRYKTATATIERPLQLGAAMAGAGGAVMDTFTELGLPLGEAFQLRDDLLDVFGSPDGACEPGLSDLREGKKTVLLPLGLSLADPVQRERLDRLVGRADLKEHEAAQVRDILQVTGARKETERMIATRYGHVLRVLDQAGLPPAANRALRGLAAKATQYTS
ncbi:polyprenyl synthetase family protein [Streptomyces sp. 130]|uniref:polyprenyl synthetase family protein n=1 Tax=Streptomyces sp. 130 TaxID=2591006 RepID=UPI0021B0A872|nr:polyprenyl synthetase family protein [Streptomyces sp. 130]